MGFPFFLHAQENWTQTDSLRLNRLLKGETEISINREAKEELERVFSHPFPVLQDHRFLIEEIPLPPPIQSVRRQILPPQFHNTPMQWKESHEARSFNYAYKRWNAHSRVETSNPRVLLKRSTDIRLNASGKVGFHLYGGYSIDRTRSAIVPATADPMHIGAGVSYQLSKNAEIRSGLERQYNLIMKRWESVWKTGIVIRF